MILFIQLRDDSWVHWNSIEENYSIYSIVHIGHCSPTFKSNLLVHAKRGWTRQIDIIYAFNGDSRMKTVFRYPNWVIIVFYSNDIWHSIRFDFFFFLAAESVSDQRFYSGANSSVFFLSSCVWFNFESYKVYK